MRDMQLNYDADGQDTKVSATNRLPVEASPKRIPDKYQIIDTVTPTGAGDYFLYLQNDDSTKKLYVRLKSLECAGNETVTIETAAKGTPAGGATPANVTNRHSGGDPLAKATIQDGVDLNSASGLATGSKIEDVELTAGTRRAVFRDQGDDGILAVLDKDRALQFKAATGTAAIDYHLEVWHE